MLHYRNTPNKGHSLSPAQRCMGRRTRSSLPMLKSLLTTDSSLDIQQQISTKREQSRKHYDKNVTGSCEELQNGDGVYVKPSPHNKGNPWTFGYVISNPTPRSYVVKTAHNNVHRNRNQLRIAKSTVFPPVSSPAIPNVLNDLQFPKMCDFNPSNSVCSRPIGSKNTLGQNDSILNKVLINSESDKHTPGNKIINLSGSSVIPDETPMYDALNNNEVSAKAKIVVPSPDTLRNEMVINSPITKKVPSHV